MAKYRFHWVDVFTDKRFGGNQLVVVPEADGLTTEQMQAIAKEFNISETVFVLPPEDVENDYKLRIFTPASELPMAGHPTVGAAFVLARLKMLRRSAVRFEEGVGVIPVTVDQMGRDTPLIYMTQPLPTFGDVIEDRQTIAEMLSIDVAELRDNVPVQIVSTGKPFVFVPIKDLVSMGHLKLRLDIWERDGYLWAGHDVFMFTLETLDPESTVHSRMFGPSIGITEDAATGAASGPLGAYLVHHGLVESEATTRMISEQGYEMGRPSQIMIEIDCEQDEIRGVRIAGTCVYVGKGHIEV